MSTKCSYWLLKKVLHTTGFKELIDTELVACTIVFYNLNPTAFYALHNRKSGISQGALRLHRVSVNSECVKTCLRIIQTTMNQHSKPGC